MAENEAPASRRKLPATAIPLAYRPLRPPPILTQPSASPSVSRKPVLNFRGMEHEAFQRMAVVPLAGNRELCGLDVSSPG